METSRTPRLAAIALCLAASPAWSAVFKCRGPDGHTSYQQFPCPEPAGGAELSPDTSPPSGAGTRVKPATVETQIEALESAERRARKERKEASESGSPKAPPDERDEARCAKHRAEAARWRREIKQGFRDRDEQEREAQMLQHHEALIRRYCPPRS